MMIRRWKTVCAIAVLATLGFAGSALADGSSVNCGLINFDFADPDEYTECFRDVLRGGFINAGTDLAGGNHPALNFTGSVGAGGGTWLTVYDPTPADNTAQSVFGDVCLVADVLMHRFNNRKGAGLLALYREGPSQKGLVLFLTDAGNTDTLVLATVDQAGKLTQLKSVALGSGILENAWYRLNLNVFTSGDAFFFIGNVFKHVPSTAPSDATLDGAVATLTFTDSLSKFGLQASGEIGIAALAISAVVDTSVTNFRDIGCD